MRYNIKYKLTHSLEYFHNKDDLVRNSNLLLKHLQVLANIGYVEALEIAFVDCFVSNKLKKTPCLLISQFKSSLEGFTNKSLFISIKRK